MSRRYWLPAQSSGQPPRPLPLVQEVCSGNFPLAGRVGVWREGFPGWKGLVGVITGRATPLLCVCDPSPVCGPSHLTAGCGVQLEFFSTAIFTQSSSPTSAPCLLSAQSSPLKAGPPRLPGCPQEKTGASIPSWSGLSGQTRRGPSPSPPRVMTALDSGINTARQLMGPYTPLISFRLTRQDVITSMQRRKTGQEVKLLASDHEVN